MAVLPYIASTRSTRGSTRFSATLRWNARRARAAALKTWMTGRASAAAVTPEQLTACPASLLGGSFCRLPAMPLETTDAAAAGGARMAARPQGGRLDRRGEPLRPAFSGGRGPQGRQGHRGFAWCSTCVPFRSATCVPVIFARACIVLLLVSFGLSYVRTLLDVS